MNPNPLLDPSLHETIREHVLDLAASASWPSRPTRSSGRLSSTFWGLFRAPRPPGEHGCPFRALLRSGYQESLGGG